MSDPAEHATPADRPATALPDGFDPVGDGEGAAFAGIVAGRRDRVGLIILDRPEALNALNRQAMDAVVGAATLFDLDETIGAIVLTGAGRAFAAGADIKEMAELSYAEATARDLFAGWDALTRIRTPLIAAVNGFALGGGCELAMMCDVIIAADTAKFGQPEINLGVVPGMGGTQRLTRAVGKAKAMELILTGRMMDAREAESAGLVARVVAAADLLDDVLAMAAGISTKSLPALQAATELVDAAFESRLTEGVARERRVFHAGFALDDQKEGMRAFIDKREPRFTHR